MNLLSTRTLICFFLCFAALAHSGCVATGHGLPAGQSQVLIQNRSLSEIQSKTEDVFYRHGFAMHGMGQSEMRFERRGGTTENLLYGNWNDNKTYTQITVFMTREDSGDYRLRLRSEVVRDTFGGDSNSKMFDVQGSRYGIFLKKIQRELQ